MLLYVTLALIILISTLWIHYNQHFKFIFFKCRSSIIPPPETLKVRTISIASDDTQREQRIARRVSTISRLSTARQSISSLKSAQKRCQCLCKLQPINGEEFDFVPMTFGLYILFMILLCILALIIEILYNYKQHNTISRSLFTFSIESYNEYYFNQIGTLNSQNNYNMNVVFITIDLILIYGVMILSIWESLFSFYRYYTIFITTKVLTIISIKAVIKKFIIYPIIFCTVFSIQIHFYYILFPLIILLHCLFNFYYALKFASLLVSQYKLFAEMTENLDGNNNNNDGILNSVRIMKRTSFICCILQSIYLSLFVMTYNVNTIYYLPIFWSISCFIFSLNFIRNRQYIYHSFWKRPTQCFLKHCQSQIEQQTASALNGEQSRNLDTKIDIDNTTMLEVSPSPTNPVIIPDAIDTNVHETALQIPSLNHRQSENGISKTPSSDIPSISHLQSKSVPTKKVNCAENSSLSKDNEPKEPTIKLKTNAISNPTPTTPNHTGSTPMMKKPLSEPANINNITNMQSAHEYDGNNTFVHLYESDDDGQDIYDKSDGDERFHVRFCIEECKYYDHEHEDDDDGMYDDAVSNATSLSQQDMDDVMGALNVLNALASHGFCSQRDLVNKTEKILKFQALMNHSAPDFYHGETKTFQIGTRKNVNDRRPTGLIKSNSLLSYFKNV